MCFQRRKMHKNSNLVRYCKIWTTHTLSTSRTCAVSQHGYLNICITHDIYTSRASRRGVDHDTKHVLQPESFRQACTILNHRYFPPSLACTEVDGYSRYNCASNRAEQYRYRRRCERNHFAYSQLSFPDVPKRQSRRKLTITHNSRRITCLHTVNLF
jgi:hypothetical protein